MYDVDPSELKFIKDIFLSRLAFCAKEIIILNLGQGCNISTSALLHFIAIQLCHTKILITLVLIVWLTKFFLCHSQKTTKISQDTNFCIISFGREMHKNFYICSTFSVCEQECKKYSLCKNCIWWPLVALI